MPLNDATNSICILLRLQYYSRMNRRLVYGDFYYAYRSLEEAKEGALARCAWNGLNRDTIMKQ